MNKLVRNIIILVAAIAVLAGGLWWVLTVEPESEQNQDDTQQMSESQTVYKAEESDISAVKIVYDGTELDFVKSGEEWTMKGYDTQQVSQTKIKSLVASVASISSSNHITENTEECGFDSPQIVVSVTLPGHTDVIMVGSKSPVLGQYFFRVNDGEIYTMSQYKADDLMKDASHYTSFERVDIVGNDVIDIKIERAGKNIIHLSLSDDENAYNAWRIDSPYKISYGANDQYVQENILAMLDSLDISTLAASASTGLSSPKAVLTVTSAPANDDGTRGEKTVAVFKIGNTNGDKTYVEYEGGAYETSSQNLAFVDVDEFMIISRLLALVPIQTLNSMSVTAGDKSYVMQIGHSNMGEDDDELSFVINENTADEDKSKKAYQEVIGLAAEGTYKGEPLGDTICEIVFLSENAKKTVTFKSINDLSASFTIDGVTEFTVKKSSVANMLSKLEEYKNNPAK